MSAYLIVDTKIENPQAYETYKAKAKPIAEKFGGIYRARGGEMEIIEGELWQPTRMVVIEFPSMEKARAFTQSEEYKPVAAIRHANAQCTLVLIEGV
jgi:uncharacterized protein (DUF1330 family)